jgi:hypothetical protein
VTERWAGQLGPDAKRALELARRLAGKQPDLKRVQGIPGGARAQLIRTLKRKQPYEIHFARGQERTLDHLVAHEVGHIVRLHQVPEEERVLAVATAENRRIAASQIAPEMVVRPGTAVPEDIYPRLFETWFSGVCTQLASFPADLRIEQWIHDRFPGLRPLQRSSLINEVHRSFPGFSVEVFAETPPTVLEATMAMNAAQAHHVAELYDLPELLGPFDVHHFSAIGAWLAHLALAPEDQGHRSDVATTNAWATQLNLDGWIGWQAPSERCLGVEVRTK